MAAPYITQTGDTLECSSYELCLHYESELIKREEVHVVLKTVDEFHYTPLVIQHINLYEGSVEFEKFSLWGGKHNILPTSTSLMHFI